MSADKLIFKSELFYLLMDTGLDASDIRDGGLWIQKRAKELLEIIVVDLHRCTQKDIVAIPEIFADLIKGRSIMPSSCALSTVSL